MSIRRVDQNQLCWFLEENLGLSGIGCDAKGQRGNILRIEAKRIEDGMRNVAEALVSLQVLRLG